MSKLSVAKPGATLPRFVRVPARRRPESTLPRSLLGAIAIGSLAPISALAQHVHGVIELGVVVEGETLAVSLSAPLSDVIGFEHAPGSEEQAERVRHAAALLADPDAMFGIAGAAGCGSSSVSVDGPDYLSEDAEAASHDDDHHDHDDDHHDHDDDHHDHDDHDHDDDHDHGETHAEVVANYEWTCSDASRLEALELSFIEGFSGVETIEVQVLTSSGARVVTAGRDNAIVPLSDN